MGSYKGGGGRGEKDQRTGSYNNIECSWRPTFLDLRNITNMKTQKDLLFFKERNGHAAVLSLFFAFSALFPPLDVDDPPNIDNFAKGIAYSSQGNFH